MAVVTAATVVSLAAGPGGAGGVEGAPSVELAPLPKAETWRHSGVAPELRDERGMVRVRMTLRSQPLLEAAARPRIADQLQLAPDPSAQRAAAEHPGRITATEKAAARRAEVSYEGAVDQLQPKADDSDLDVDQVARLIRRRGGEVLDRELIPAAVVARLPAKKLAGVRSPGLIASIESAPVEKPLSGIGTQAVGAPTWWAAGYTGGKGTNDTVPADAGVSSEIPDAAHPAFLGIPVDNYPSLDPPITTRRV